MTATAAAVARSPFLSFTPLLLPLFPPSFPFFGSTGWRGTPGPPRVTVPRGPRTRTGSRPRYPWERRGPARWRTALRRRNEPEEFKWVRAARPGRQLREELEREEPGRGTGPRLTPWRVWRLVPFRVDLRSSWTLAPSPPPSQTTTSFTNPERTSFGRTMSMPSPHHRRADLRRVDSCVASVSGVRLQDRHPQRVVVTDEPAPAGGSPPAARTTRTVAFRAFSLPPTPPPPTPPLSEPSAATDSCRVRLDVDPHRRQVRGAKPDVRTDVRGPAA